MKATYLKVYVSKKGNDTFLYKVTGTEEELEAYREAKGEFARDDEQGNPLWFSTNYVGESCPLEITTNGNVVADRSELKKALSLAKQTGGNLGEAIAAGAANMVLGTMFGTPAPAAAPVTAASTPAQEQVTVEITEESLEDVD